METFGPEQGFYVAAALTEYDSNTEIIEEAKYGELVIEYNGWGYSDELGDNKKTPLSYHPCTDSELGLEDGPDNRVYPLSDSQMQELTTYKKKFKCIDPTNFKIWGDYNSRKA